MALTLAFDCPALKQLRGVDCSTPKCFANAHGTGRIMRGELAGQAVFHVEFDCPDCGSLMHVHSADVDRLVEELAVAPAGKRDSIAERWVAPRIGDVHPCRPRPQ
jgi:hypothetical protein